jgi:hypothetical protein
MKAIINEVIFRKEFESKFGKMYSFTVKYDSESAIYNSKYKDQKKFIAGQEAEFTEESKTYIDKKTGEEKEYKVIKPFAANSPKQSNFGKALNKEKSRYSGFAVSYAKDLLVAGRISREELPDYAWILFELMVEMDKSLES